jgi:hypothetical protein
LLLTVLLSAVHAESPPAGMFVQFRIVADNPRVLSTQNISLPVYDQRYRKIEDFEAKAGYFPVREFSFDDQFKFLRKITKDIPFNWQESDTAIYLVFKATPIKADTYLLQLDEAKTAVKKPGDVTANEFLVLPTTFTTEKELKESEFYKSLRAEHSAAVEKEITDWIQAHPPSK